MHVIRLGGWEEMNGAARVGVWGIAGDYEQDEPCSPGFVGLGFPQNASVRCTQGGLCGSEDTRPQGLSLCGRRWQAGLSEDPIHHENRRGFKPGLFQEPSQPQGLALFQQRGGGQGGGRAGPRRLQRRRTRGKA